MEGTLGALLAAPISILTYKRERQRVAVSVKATCTNAVPTIQSDFILYVSFILLLLSSRNRMSICFSSLHFQKWEFVPNWLTYSQDYLIRRCILPFGFICLFCLFVSSQSLIISQQRSNIYCCIYDQKIIFCTKYFFNFFIIFTFFFPRKIIF